MVDLEAACRELESGEAMAMALVLAHEGRIETLMARNAELEALLREAYEALRQNVYHQPSALHEPSCAYCAVLARLAVALGVPDAK